MRILVCGGRDFCDQEFEYKILDMINVPGEVSMIIEGGAAGADTLAKNWAISRGISFTEFKADWKKYGKAAGYIRNKQMLVEGKPDLVIAFPGGIGTQNMIEQTKKAGIRVKSFSYK